MMGLKLIPELGNVRIYKLLEHFESAQMAWEADWRQLKSVPGIGEGLANKIVTERNLIDINYWKKIIISQNIEVITPGHFPDLLTEIYDCPVILFARGDLSLLTGPKLGVVGTRKVTGYGQMAMQKVLPSIINEGITVVSGLASGVDALAHKLTLKHSGKTIAVLGNSLDIAYPAENKELMEQIAHNGLLLTEYFPGTTPQKHHFPQRNRIISGLSEGVLVVEAPERSGAIITAQLALEQNRDVFAIPGNINSPCSQGCNKLIADGAKLVSDSEDILTEYNLTVNMLLEESSVQLTLDYQNLLEQIPFREIAVDELVTANYYENLHTMLLELELNGFIMRRMGGYVIRVK